MPQSPLALIADIGGTHVRFALVGAKGGPGDAVVLDCADYADLPSAVGAFLQDAGAVGRVKRGALAIAGPVRGDRVEMTNLSWSFSTQELRRQLGFDELRVVNDFTAIALALPHVTDTDRRQIGGGTAEPGAPIGVVGPGTGLGMSAFISSPDGGIALETEGGHATLAAANAAEAQVIEILRRRFGHVSAERALSGPGLVNLYEALAELGGAPAAALTPAEISAHGIAAPDSLSGKAVGMFCAMLGTVASNLALALGAHGGIYIAGGIPAKLGDAFARSGFRQRFEDKGRFSAYLAGIPTYIFTHPNPALLGLSASLARDEGPLAKRRLS